MGLSSPSPAHPSISKTFCAGGDGESGDLKNIKGDKKKDGACCVSEERVGNLKKSSKTLNILEERKWAPSDTYLFLSFENV